jgi:ribosomal protein L37E
MPNTLTKDTIWLMHDWIRSNRLRDTDELKIFGTYLYNIIFTGEVHNLFSETCKMIDDRKQNNILRVILEFEDGSKDLITYPWEYLYYPGASKQLGFFISSKSTLILSRHVPRNIILPDPIPKTLNLLVVTSSPKDLDKITWEPIVQAIQDLKAEFPERLSIQHLQDPTLKDLRITIEQFRPQILHFIGHGMFNRDTSHGEIALVKLHGEDFVPDWIEDTAFVETFEDFPPQIVFLQACEGAVAETVERFKGLALSLIKTQVPAVIAMQYKIENLAASIFAKKFYESLAAGNFIDQAVQYGRKSLKDIWRENNLNCRAFGTPVAYTRFMNSIIMIPDQAVQIEDNQNKTPSPNSVRCGRCQKNTFVGNYCAFCGFDLLTKSEPHGNYKEIVSRDIREERMKETTNI